MMEDQEQFSFTGYLEYVHEIGSFKNEDLIACIAPFLEEIHILHQQGKVAPLRDLSAVYIQNHRLILKPGSEVQPARTKKNLFTKPKTDKSRIEVTGEYREITEAGYGFSDLIDLGLFTGDRLPSKPVYLSNYRSWEDLYDQHDPLSDIYHCGLLMASLAFNLNFNEEKDMQTFLDNREGLYFLNSQLHATILSIIYEMTALYREDRPRSLDSVIAKLNNYRDYNPEHYEDLTQTEGFRKQELSTRNNWILHKLKSRLFDISRRNRLLYYKEQSNFLNLTVASVPLLLDYKNINANSLFYWNEPIQKRIAKSDKLALSNYLRFEENSFLAPKLDKIRLEATRSKNEYGFNQLRLVIGFLHWYNFKENEREKISSPLLLVPVELVKKKGVKDRFILEITSTEAEVNPVLTYYLKELYNIDLPDFTELNPEAVKELITGLEKQVANNNTGIKIAWRDTPRIKLLHKVAHRNYTHSQRRVLGQTRGLDLRSFDYSYQTDSFQPLGIQLFKQKVKKTYSDLEYIINEDIHPAPDHLKPEAKRTFYHRDDGEINPYQWEIDTCNFTLGNFNSKKMSLVRDYNDIIDQGIEDKVFEELFSDQPRKLSAEELKPRSLAEQYPVIQADPTQLNAINKAGSALNYIIQGPPGTGKSQTITNLIADYVARDKKVLFVCEKRAALDVVFHRLKQRSLGDLCALIHDSLSDKKSFIMNLKATYTSYLEDKYDLNEINNERTQAVRAIEKERAVLQGFHESMADSDQSNYPFHKLFDLLISKKNSLQPTEKELEEAPDFEMWQDSLEAIENGYILLKDMGYPPYFSRFPLIHLDRALIGGENPVKETRDAVDEAISITELFTETLDGIDLPEDLTHTVSDLFGVIDTAYTLKPIVESGNLAVLQKDSSIALKFDEDITRHRDLSHELKEQVKQNANWQDKFSFADTQTALAQWQKYQASIFRFFKPGYYQLKKQIETAYNFSAHKIKPDILKLLKALYREYELEHKLQKLEHDANGRFGYSDFEALVQTINTFRGNSSNTLVNRLLNESISIDSINEIATLSDDAQKLNKQIKRLNLHLFKAEFVQLEVFLNIIRKAVTHLPEGTSLLQELFEMPDPLQHALKKIKYTKDELEYLCALKSIEKVYSKKRNLKHTEGATLTHSINHINKLFKQYYDLNSKWIRARIRKKFSEKIQITELSASVLSPEEKLLKKAYKKGRKVLENEFGKSMRYKSIRELATNEAGEVILDLKPVWLMSPLSVSDTLPLNTNYFDVVIYDEASQITIEEGVPSLFRTEQTIIVGDEMQMPPTNFFNTSISTAEEEEQEIENKIGISLDADSLLNQGSRKLPSVMLGWHYRSRHESLISFSNSAFYARELLTIPDVKVINDDISPITITGEDSGDDFTDALFDRSISFHYQELGVYEVRRNKREAGYIAQMLRSLLFRKTGLSIGIVAFSMDQQSQIEEALEDLANQDKDFGVLLEKEYQREAEDQYVGLFVKNLENVQGDERDIIIMSICYGYNANGKMLMNFGPINRRGGEKRLNVIFSRAKKHMAVVSSIHATDVKNDYNEGANYFKKFLEYAEHISSGHLSGADAVLNSLSDEKNKWTDRVSSPILGKIQQEIEKMGYAAHLLVGQSHFRVHLGIAEKESKEFLMGILLDDEKHYHSKDLIEQYCQRPAVLKNFGWKVLQIYAKDWYHNPEKVIGKIKNMLANVEEIPKIPTIAIESEQLPPPNKGTEIEETATDENPPETPENSITSDYERYQFKDSISDKFWEVKIVDTNVHVRFGRSGTKGQERIKTYPHPDKARKEKEKLVRTKLAKGYKKG